MATAPYLVHYVFYREAFRLQPQNARENRLVMADSDEGVHDLKKTASINRSGSNNGKEMKTVSKSGSQTVSDLIAKSEYCEKLQEWMWQYYCGYVSWQSWVTVFPFPPCFPTQAATGSLRAPTWGVDLPTPDLQTWISHSSAVAFSSFPSVPPPSTTTAAHNASERQVEINGQSQNLPVPQNLQQNGNAQQPGTEASFSVIKVINIQLNLTPVPVSTRLQSCALPLLR